MSKLNFYTGSYAKKGEESIIQFAIDKESLSYEKVKSITDAEEPSYVCLNEDKTKLYAAMELFQFNGEDGGAVATYDVFEDKMVKTTAVNSKGTLPCHIWFDGQRNCVYASNYWSGSISMYGLDENKNAVELKGMSQHSGTGPNVERQEGPHVHFSGPSQDGAGLWVVDLGIDRVKYYELKDQTLVSVEEKDLHLPAGAGPRHFVTSKLHNGLLYVVCELNSEIAVINTNDQTIVQRISTLPSSTIESACAAIRISKNGKYIYASNRGHDSIAVFEVLEDGTLKCIQTIGTDGKNPRDFNLTDGLLLVANQDSNCISVFRYEEETGLLTSTKKTIPCCKPSCIAF